jgi:hypothetical protein
MYAILAGQRDFLMDIIKRSPESSHSLCDGSMVGGVPNFFSPDVIQKPTQETGTMLTFLEQRGLNSLAEQLRIKLRNLIDQCTTAIAKGSIDSDHPLSFSYKVRADAWLALGEAEKAAADLEKSKTVDGQ